MFLKEIIEVRDLRKAKGKRNFADMPAAVFQQHFRFLQNAFGNELRRCLKGLSPSRLDSGD